MSQIPIAAFVDTAAALIKPTRRGRAGATSNQRAAHAQNISATASAVAITESCSDNGNRVEMTAAVMPAIELSETYLTNWYKAIAVAAPANAEKIRSIRTIELGS